MGSDGLLVWCDGTWCRDVVVVLPCLASCMAMGQLAGTLLILILILIALNHSAMQSTLVPPTEALPRHTLSLLAHDALQNLNVLNRMGKFTGIRATSTASDFEGSQFRKQPINEQVRRRPPGQSVDFSVDWASPSPRLSRALLIIHGCKMPCACGFPMLLGEPRPLPLRPSAC